MLFVNERGATVRLGPQLTTPGGEAAVFEVASDPACVAKLYHTIPDAQKATKLQHLCRVENAALLSIAAWPRYLLFERTDRRTIRGFLMPRIEGKEIHRLYGPHDRALEFPTAAWDFLIFVARNCGAAFETLHENGFVMGDVNEKNLLVTPKGLVRFIDCDSYQFRNGSKHFACDVGVPFYTPPELQNRVQQHGYHGLERTPNHDRFGLAVLIFELLFMGRHPFAGVPDTHQEFEIHEAIQRFLFAFSPQTWCHGVKAPPHTLPLGALPERLVRLFERAFLPGSDKQEARPTGREWAHELDALYAARKTCSCDPGHKYWNGLTGCPWCQIAAGSGHNFFISVALHIGSPGAVLDVSAFWATIQRIANGDLMRKKVEPIQSPPARPRPMPFPRPTPPNLRKPESPPPPLPLPTPSLPPPILPPGPVPLPLTPVPKIRIGASEHDVRASVVGIIVTALSCWTFASLELIPGALFSGIGTLIFLVAWARKVESAAKERRQRHEAEQRALEDEIRRVEQIYSSQIAGHKATVTRIKAEHARSVAEANATREREQSRLNIQYRSKLSAFSAQLSLFENAWARFENGKRKWEQESRSRALSVEQTTRELSDCWERLRHTIDTYQGKARGILATLDPAYRRFQKATAEEAADMQALEAKKRDVQLRQFLDSKLIRKHRIAGIGKIKGATLVAYGVESALDITPGMDVPGIGHVLLRNLLTWKAGCVAAFRYNPNTPVPQAEMQAVKLKYAQAKQSALAELRGGAATLSSLESETRQAITGLESTLPKLANAHAQALADKGECS